MIGDADWLFLLEEAYAQHCADSARYEREPLPWETWAVNRAWSDFVRIARFAEHIPAFALKDWATSNPVPGTCGSGYGSRVLARRMIDAVVLVEQLLKDLRREDRAVAKAVREYLRANRRDPTNIATAKRFIYDWLVNAAKREKWSRAKRPPVKGPPVKE